jgi:hypothetical protein
MGLMDDVTARATVAAAERAKNVASDELRHAQEAARVLSTLTGYPVQIQPAVQLAGSDVGHRPAFGGRAEYLPEMIERRLFVVEDVRLAAEVRVNYSRAWSLVRACSTCNRLAVDELHGLHLKTDHTEEGQRKIFADALAGQVLKAPQCTFCKAADDAAVCPTCHRGWGR